MSLFAIANKDMSGQLLDQFFYLQLCNPVVNFDASMSVLQFCVVFVAQWVWMLQLKAIKGLFSITVRLVPSELLQVLSDLDDFKA